MTKNEIMDGILRYANKMYEYRTAESMEEVGVLCHELSKLYAELRDAIGVEDIVGVSTISLGEGTKVVFENFDKC
jgi:hypothetical protein